MLCVAGVVETVFLPTPSARRATGNVSRVRVGGLISTHALREEGDGGQRFQTGSRKANFYPRPPRGGRQHYKCWRHRVLYFYPRPPRGGRLLQGIDVSHHQISTHALREEGDIREAKKMNKVTNFYPRPPRGGRPEASASGHCHRRYFYPRPPRGGRREKCRTAASYCTISTHALREEGDLTMRSLPSQSNAFLPTPSARRATFGPFLITVRRPFLPTPSARRATSLYPIAV